MFFFTKFLFTFVNVCKMNYQSYNWHHSESLKFFHDVNQEIRNLDKGQINNKFKFFILFPKYWKMYQFFSTKLKLKGGHYLVVVSKYDLIVKVKTLNEAKQEVKDLNTA